MTPEERLQRISELRDANEKSRAEIERREAELAADPLGFDLVKLADRRATGLESDLAYTDAADKPVGAAHMQRTDARGMLYRRGPENEPASAPAGDADVSNGGAFFGDERDDMLARALGTIAATLRDEWRRDMAALHRRTVACRHDIGKLRERIDSTEASGIEVYCNAFDRRLAVLEAENIRLKALLGPAAEIVELPKGFLRRTHHNAA